MHSIVGISVHFALKSSLFSFFLYSWFFFWRNSILREEAQKRVEADQFNIFVNFNQLECEVNFTIIDVVKSS